jgi:hypothetical protein
MHCLVCHVPFFTKKVVFVAEICQMGNFTKPPGLTFQTYNKLFGDNFVKFKNISFPGDFDKDLVHYSPSGMNVKKLIK